MYEQSESSVGRQERDETLVSEDGVDRRGFLECMAWAGTGLLCSVTGGLLSSSTIAAPRPAAGGFEFVQISDSHIGFSKDANKNVAGTLQTAVDRINALPERPAFLLHTGDISHLCAPEEFDTADQILRGAKVGAIFTVPGEHDVLDEGGKRYLERYGKGSHGAGWYSFDHGGVHFIGLVNVTAIKLEGLGSLGKEQLTWLERDVARLRSSTPIVVFAHVPLWAVYPKWGWATDDGARALSLLKRFGSVTVLNGHIHQTLQKIEGRVTFHTAASTAFPQPAPGAAAGPGPMKVADGRLREVLGITSVTVRPGGRHLALVDSPLG